MKKLQSKKTFLIFGLSSLLTACGGGGDSESSEPELAENEVVMVTDGGKEIITEKTRISDNKCIEKEVIYQAEVKQ